MPQEKETARSDGLPSELRRMLDATDEVAREAAWNGFVRRYNRLLLHTAHQQSSTYDAAMDRYAYVLEKLREDGFRRLEQYSANGAARFDTWLVVVARRLCIDHLRARYGRQEDGTEGDPDQAYRTRVRRRLTDLLTEELELDGIPDPRARDPDRGVRVRELRAALREGVEELSTRDRLLVKLRFEEELTAREIAGLMDYSSPFEVYRRIRKVLARLRKELEERGVDGPVP